MEPLSFYFDRDSLVARGEITEAYSTPDAVIGFEWVNPEAPGPLPRL